MDITGMTRRPLDGTFGPGTGPDPTSTGLRDAAERPEWPRRVALVLAIAAVAAPSQARAQAWKFEPSISLQETVTNNVNLDPTDTRISDWVTQITPALTFSEKGDRTTLSGSVSVPILFYARTGSENNSVYPSGNLFGDVNFFERRFHIEGSVNVSQEFFSAFGAQPQDFTNATNNRYRATTYQVSPYYLGAIGNDVEYELRNNNTWANLDGAPIDTNNSFTTEFLAKAGTIGDRMVGWSASYDYTNVKFNNQDSRIVTQLGRVSPFYSVTPQFRVDASVGYESNDYLLTSSSGVIYGVGFRWRPTERTNVTGNWEHRFFGASYNFAFDHRTPLTVWNVQVSRNISTYPQQIASLAAGSNVSSSLNQLFLSSIPDPIARQTAVDNLIQQRGLPSTLTSPVSLYTEQITLVQQQSATVGLLGARNSIFFNVFNVLSEPITASGNVLPPSLFSANANTQTGGSIVWTNRLTQAVNLTATFTVLRTVANPPLEFRTNQGYAQVSLSTPITARTTGFVGARYQSLSSDIASTDYNEAAAFIGFNYALR